MNRRALEVVVVAVAVASATATASCSRTVPGSPQRAIAGTMSERGYGYADNRCGLLTDATIQQMVELDRLDRPYSGAVCQFIGTRQSAVVDLTYSWFETGSLARERALAEANTATVTDIVIERHTAFVARRSVTGNACSVTAETSPGVASWWVQIRGDEPIDPCTAAQELLAKTLTSDM